MDTTNLPAIITAVVALAFLVYTGIRLGAQFLVKRIAGLLFVILGVTFITFMLGHFAPGDAVSAQLGQHYADKNLRESLDRFYGLDQPGYVQYFSYMWKLLHFDLGYSWTSRTIKVWDILNLFVPTSAFLGISSLALSLIVGIPLGTLAAIRANTRFDTVIQTVGLVLFAIPSFVIIPFFQLAMLWLDNNGYPFLPPTGWGDWSTELAPITITGITAFAFYMRFTRTSFIEVLRQDYVRTARAKGLEERVVIWRHAFRNAVLPLITIVGPAIGYVVTGLFITEELFNIPGIGYEALAAIQSRDFPVVEGVGILLAVAVALMNLVADVAYGIVDPRIKVS